MNRDKLNLMGVPVDVDKEEPAKLEVRANNDRVLMSDVLRGNVPELEGGPLEELAAQHVIVTIQYVIDPQTEASVAVGSLRGIMFDGKTVELETGVQLDDGLTFLQHGEMIRAGFELHPGDDEGAVISRFAVPMRVTGVRLMDIDYRRAMCTLLLQLKPTGSLVNGEVSDE